MFKKSLLLGSTIMLAASAPAFAQDVPADEIIVTATKRAQTLQEVPLAVTVTTAETIEKARILDILDLQSVVPSLRVSQLQNSVQTNFVIRGFGNGANNAGIEPSVGVFVDGVYRSRSGSSINDLPKLERIEVLRGPQSTLFGKNASAGVISVVTAKPSFTSEGYIEGTLGNYDARQVKGYFSGPLTDNVAVSLGGSLNKRDGYAENVTTGTELNDRDRFSLRGQALFQPTDNVEFRIIADYDKLEEICCFAPNLRNGPTGAAIPLLGGEVVTDPFGYRTALTFDPENEVENQGVSFHADVDFGDITMTSITAYRNSSAEQDGDVDFNSADIIQQNRSTVDLKTFTQELRFATNFDGPLNGVFGAFYFNEDVDQTGGISFGQQFRNYAGILAGDQTLFGTLEFLSGTAPGTFFRTGDGVSERARQDDETFNLFAQGDYEITDRLTATVGLAYVDASKQVSLQQTNTDVFSNTDLFTVNGGLIPQAFFGAAFPDAFAGAFAGQFMGTPIEAACGLTPTPAALNCVDTLVGPGTSAALQAGVTSAVQAGVTNSINGLGALQFLPQLIGIPNGVEDGRSHDTNLDYTIRLAYDVSDSINVYGSYATGYKSTSWNLSRDSRISPTDATALFPNGTQPFNLVTGTRRADPEEASVFELGLKAKFDQGSLNLAVFDQTIKNFQSNVFTGAAFSLANAEKQSVRGFEWEALWRPLEGLTLGSAGTYLDPEYDEFTASAFGDITGTTPAGIPELSLSTSIGYEFDIGQNTAFIRADHQYESEVDIQDGGDLNPANIALDPLGFRTREISIFNASAGMNWGDLDLTVWGRNVFGDEFVSTNFATVIQDGSFNGYASPPATYGITARYNFGG